MPQVSSRKGYLQQVHEEERRTGFSCAAVMGEMSPFRLESLYRYYRDLGEESSATPLDPLSEYIDAEQTRQAIEHSFEILQAREGGFDKAVFLQKALDIITSVWTATGIGNVGSVGPLLTPWCSRQWEQAAPRFLAAQPPTMTTEQLSLEQAILGDDVDLVEVRVGTLEGRLPQGFPEVWAFARPRVPGGDAPDWRLESVRAADQPETA